MYLKEFNRTLWTGKYFYDILPIQNGLKLPKKE
jgi:hypothetical protein